MRIPARIAALLTAALVLALPAVAQAKTKRVLAGTPPKNAQQFQSLGTDVNAYFPSRVTIHKGDTVKFVPAGFHTIDLPRRGRGALPLLVPGQPVSGVNDAAGVPFWFNGQPNFSFNPRLLQGAFGQTRSYRGKRRINSGLPLAPDVKPMRVKFKRRGTYTYYCDVHPGMKGKVVVKRKSAAIPTAKQDRKRVRKQVRRARNRAKGLASTQPPANTAYVGGSARGGVEYYGMLPAKLQVAPGTTVTFMMSPRSFDIHTATFGDRPEDPNSYLNPIARSFEGAPVIDPRGVYPSERPGTPPALYSSALHGNGFWNSGVLDNGDDTPPASSNRVTFTTPGTYDYYCLIHPFMHGQVEVG